MIQLLEDHVRIYSVRVLRDRLKSVGFKVEILHFQEEPNNYHGFKEDEYVLVAEKSRT